MEILRLNRGESEIAMEEWKNSFPQLPALNKDYTAIRNDLTVLFRSVLDKAEEENLKVQDYNTDVQFGIRILIITKRKTCMRCSV